MKSLLILLLAIISTCALADTPDVSIPEDYRQLMRTADFVEITGTNEIGGAENFTIHNSKAITEFVGFLTSERYTPVPKDLKPNFKSPSSYHIRLSAHGALILEFQIIAESIIDLPKEPSFYMESDHYSDKIMAPLLRLR